MSSPLPIRAGDRPRTTPTGPPTAVMIYAPRDEAELDVVERLVRAAHAFARPAG